MDNLFSVGINHSTSDATLRSRLALHEEQQDRLYTFILKSKEHSFFILNTCNRTEIYGVGNVETILNAYSKIVGDPLIDQGIVVRKYGQEALLHIFKVASGLDSQVIGDLEILGQFKKALKKAKQFNALDGYMERLSNMAIQVAKEIKSKTKISTGTVSLSYAATKFIKRYIDDKFVRILLVGTGDFGKRIAINIKDYLPEANLTLCNRTFSKAQELGEMLRCQVVSFEKLASAIDQHDVIICSINDSGSFFIHEGNVARETSSKKIFIDMSIPFSIDPVLASSSHILVNIDEISKEIDQTIESRKEELPIALEMVDHYMQEFIAWASLYEKSSSLRQWKKMVTNLSRTCPHLQKMELEQRHKIVEKSLADFARYIKNKSDLPNENDLIIHHYLMDSDRAIACQKANNTLGSYSIQNCSACQVS